MQKALEIRSLELPLTDLERQLALFRAKVDEARFRQVRTKDVLTGDQKRVIDWLEDTIRQMQRKANEHFFNRAVSLLEESGYQAGTVYNTVADEIPDFCEHKLRMVSHTIEQTVSVLLNEHQKDVDDLIRSIRMTAANLFDIPLHEAGEKKVGALERVPYWVSRKGWQTLVGAITQGVAGKLIPLTIRKGKIQSEIKNNLNRLILHNTENIRWATLQNINMTFFRFVNEFDMDINRIIEATGGAVDTTLRFRSEHTEKIADRLADCKRILAYVEEWEKLYRSE